MLAATGVPVPPGRTTADVDGAVAAARELHEPLVLKLSSPRIQHKSEIGAIAVGVSGSEGVAAEAGRLLALPEAEGASLLVEEMAPPGVELLVSAGRDGVVPALVVGLGGIWTEALGDVAVIPLPASTERVEAALRSLRGAPLLTGGRGTAPTDLHAAATAAALIGEALLQHDLGLIEVNPLIAASAGCFAVDALASRR